jgi:hypothetical protein
MDRWGDVFIILWLVHLTSSKERGPCDVSRGKKLLLAQLKDAHQLFRSTKPKGPSGRVCEDGGVEDMNGEMKQINCYRVRNE